MGGGAWSGASAARARPQPRQERFYFPVLRAGGLSSTRERNAGHEAQRWKRHPRWEPIPSSFRKNGVTEAAPAVPNPAAPSPRARPRSWSPGCNRACRFGSRPRHGSSASEDRELQAERLSRLFERAAALDEARHRLQAGVYGICISCNEAIPHNRLRAIPEALLCTPCQEEAERGHPREIHAHEWKLAEEAYRERRQAAEGESAAIPGAIGVEPG
jgi:RNA polymerase-binding transcription factor DksA